MSFKVWQREHLFLSAYDLDKYTSGATKEGIPLHSQTLQAVNAELAVRRKQFKKVKLRWRVSGGTKRSLGWVPFKASTIRYKAGQPISLWDSYGLSDYELGAGSFSEDISPVCVVEHLSRLLPNAQLYVVEGGDYDLAETHAVEIAPLIDRFLLGA